jgi:deoxyribodipyrimidine photo-lyase
MDTPIIIWFRSDLRVHDHPALAAAVRDGVSILPVFIFNDAITKGKFSSSNRNRFLLESLADLKTSLKKIGGDLVIRNGEPVAELQKLATETGAKKVYYTADYTPLSIRRDKEVTEALEAEGIEARGFGGKLALNSLQKLTTKSGSAFKVFTPFWRAWSQVERREVAATPQKLTLPKVRLGSLPAVSALTKPAELSEQTLKGGETQARKRLKAFIDNGLNDYHTLNNEMASEGTSRLSAYLHFGCLSVREIETMLPDTQGARAWHRQLAWREFYHYVIFHFPHPEHEFQERYRSMGWSKDERLLDAWKKGATGYPVVDAAMRQKLKGGCIIEPGLLSVHS